MSYSHFQWKLNKWYDIFTKEFKFTIGYYKIVTKIKLQGGKQNAFIEQ